MAIIRCEVCNTCPANSGLSEITANVIVGPTCSDRAVTYADRVVRRIPERVFQTFVQDIVADPTRWTFDLIAETRFGSMLARYSYRHISIVDVVTSHTIKNPKEILLTIELDARLPRVSTYQLAVWRVLDKGFKVVDDQGAISSVRGSNACFPGANHCLNFK